MVARRDAARFHMDDVGAACTDQLRVMGDDIGGPAALPQLPKKLRGLQHVAVIKAAGGLIEEQDRAPGGYGRRNGQALLCPPDKEAG